MTGPVIRGRAGRTPLPSSTLCPYPYQVSLGSQVILVRLLFIPRKHARRSPAAFAASPAVFARRADDARRPVGDDPSAAGGRPGRDPRGGVTVSNGGRRAGPRLVGLVAGRWPGRLRFVLCLRKLQPGHVRDQSSVGQIAVPHG